MILISWLRNHLTFLFLIGSVSLVLSRSLFWENSWHKALYDFDEARYAEVAKNILKTGNWLIPMAGGPDEPRDKIIYTLQNGEDLYPYFWKPPMATWLMALSFKIFGITELAARLPTMVSAGIILIVLFHLTKSLFPKHSWAAYIAVIIFSLLSDFSFLSSQGLVELPMLLFGLLSIYLANQQTKSRLFLSGVTLGLAFMTKSFITYWIPMIGLVLILFNAKNGGYKKVITNIFLYSIGALLIILPWHLYMWHQFGQLFVEKYILVNISGRLAGETGNQAPWKWYFIYMLDQWKPFVFVLPALMGSFINRKMLKSKSFWLLVFWIMVIIIPLSLATSKVYWYIFPIWVPITVLLALAIEQIYKNGKYLVLVLSAFCLMFSLLPFWQLSLRHTPIKEFTIFAVLIFMTSAIVTRVTKKFHWWSLAILAVPLLVLNINHNYITSQQRLDTNRPLKTLIKRQSAMTNLAIINYPYEAALFYADSGNITQVVTEKTSWIITANPLPDPQITKQNFQLVDREENFLIYQKVPDKNPKPNQK